MILGLIWHKKERGDVAVMCNLGEGIYEDGLMKGKQEGWEKGRKEGKLECPWKKWQSIANYHWPWLKNRLNKINWFRSSWMYDVWSDSFQLQTQKEAVAYATASWFFGATNRIRTYDPLITNEMLCQLSYSGKYSYIIFTRPIVVNTFFKLFWFFLKRHCGVRKQPRWGRRTWWGCFRDDCERV